MAFQVFWQYRWFRNGKFPNMILLFRDYLYTKWFLSLSKEERERIIDQENRQKRELLSLLSGQTTMLKECLFM